MEIYNRYVRHRPYRDQAALLGGVGLYGAIQGYRYLRNQYNMRRRGLYGQAVKGAFLSLKKNNKMPPTPPTPPKTPMKGKKRKPRKQLKRKYKKAKKQLKAMKKRATTTKVNMGNMNMRPVTTKRSKKNGILQYGVKFTTESGSDQVTDPDCVYIGHSTGSMNNIIYGVAAAIVKRTAIEANLDTASLFADIALGTGDQWRLVYRNGYDQGDALATHTFTGGATYKLIDVVDDYFAFLSVGRVSTFNIAYVEYVPGQPYAPYCKINMIDATVRIIVRSELKVQNRTLSATGSTSTETVDSIPISGKLYFGKGTGTTYVANTVAFDPFIAEDTTGLILKVAGTNPTLKEPPAPSNFGNCSKYGYATFQPGEVQKSILTTNVTYKINNFFREIVNSVNETYSYNTFGVYRFYGLEKVLDVGVGDYQSIKLGYEHNLDVTCSLNFKRNMETATFTR